METSVATNLYRLLIDGWSDVINNFSNWRDFYKYYTSKYLRSKNPLSQELAYILLCKYYWDICKQTTHIKT